MDYWHMQMNRPWGRGKPTIDSAKMLKENTPVIGIQEWKNIQCLQFKGENDGLKEGDIILVREGQRPLAICKITSKCFQDKELTQKYFFEHFREVEILGWANDSMPVFPKPIGTLQILYHGSKTDSWKRALTVVRRRDASAPLPGLFILSTDGFANSYKDEPEFQKTCIDYFDMIKLHGAKAVEASLKNWLAETSEMGCGDDITLLMAYYFDSAGEINKSMPIQTKKTLSQAYGYEKQTEARIFYEA